MHAYELNGSVKCLGSWFVTDQIRSMNLKFNSCILSSFCCYQYIGHIAACITVRTREDCCLRTPFMVFQFVSRGRDFRQLIPAPLTFPEAPSLGFHFIPTAIFSNFEIQSKYNSGLPSNIGMLSFKELFT